MNGLQVTGTKLNSPPPQKKSVLSNRPKVPTQKPEMNKSRRISAPVIQKKIQKKDTLQKKPIVQQKKPVQVVQQKKQQQIQENKQSSLVVPEETPQVQKQEIAQFEVMVKYNHYKDKFQTNNGILSFVIVDQRYCFKLVFKGNYQPVLKIANTREQINPQTSGIATEFTWKVNQGEIYVVQILEDEQEESKYERKIYKAPQPQKKCPFKKNQRVTELTAEMKKLGITQLGSEKHRQLLEQRDLEDILYS